MGVAEIIPGGGQRGHFAYLVYVAEVAMQMDVHKTVYCFYTTKKIPSETTCSIPIYFEIFFKRACVHVCHKGVLSNIRYSFCSIGA